MKKSILAFLILMIGRACYAADHTQIESLVQRLQSGDDALCVSCLDELARLDTIPTELHAPLIAALVDPRTPKTQKGAALRLYFSVQAQDLVRRIGAPAASLLRAPLMNQQTRWQAISVLEGLGKDAVCALPEIIVSLKDKNEHVRYFAAKTIIHIGPDASPAVDALIPLIDDKSESAQEYAIKALGAIGPKASKALDALRKKRDYQNPLAEGYVQEAIALITEPNKALVPTATAVTPAADAPVAPAAAAAHL